MAFLKEQAEWAEGIRQFELDDVVQGGPEGVDNIPIAQLASRTVFLRRQNEATDEKINNHNHDAAYSHFDHTHSAYAPISSPSFTGAPTTPMPDDADDSMKIANTSWVNKTINKIVEVFDASGLVKKTGDMMKGSLVVDGGTISVRTVGTPAQGTYFFGDQSGGARYIGYNATAYQLPNASLYVGGDVFSKNIRLARIDEIPVVPPSVGNNQTWQDVTASRAAGTTYYNTTGKPIQLSIDRSSGGANASAHTLTIGGVGASSISVSATQIYTNLNHIVPPGASYSLAITGSASILKWAELR